MLDDMLRQLSPKRPSLLKRLSRSLARFLILFCIGVTATLAWQSYGDEARRMIASSSPELGWLAPQAEHNDTPSPETMRQSLVQFAANQQQMAGDIAKLLTDQRDLLRRFRRHFRQRLLARQHIVGISALISPEVLRRSRRADVPRHPATDASSKIVR